jgi:hypothetical protein
VNTRKEAEAALSEFMDSDEKVVLLTGTNEYQKRVLALQTLVNQEEESTILFRSNYTENLKVYYGAFDTTFRTGRPYRVENHTLYIDTMKETSWEKSPLEVNHAILYPLDHFLTLKERQRLKVIDDLMRRVSGKILLVNFADDADYAWFSDIGERHVVYDVEEGDPPFDQKKKEFNFEYVPQK